MQTNFVSYVTLSILSLLFSCCAKSVINSATVKNSAKSLASSNWVLYQYQTTTMVNPQQRNDTLIFTTDKIYSWNHSSASYSLIDNQSGVLHLTLENTPFGNLSGTMPNNFTSAKEIIGAPFSPLLAGNTQTYNLWFKQIN